MKKLLSVVAILGLAASLLPAKGQAGLRGAFDPITNSDKLTKGHYSAAYRPQPKASSTLEKWFSFVTFSTVVGSESVGEIWQNLNSTQAAANNATGNILDARRPILQDPTGVISYIDPAWSADGKYLAYVKTNNYVTAASIYIDQYKVSTTSLTAVTPEPAFGGPLLVADGTGGVHHRHPAWASTATPGRYMIAYDSDAAGVSIDLWTVEVDLNTRTVDEPTRQRRTTISNKAEFKPAFSPNGTKLAFVSNLFGAFQIFILNLADNSFAQAETNLTSVSHDNPAWSSNGLSLYYDAPANEDPSLPQDIWKLDLATQAKCSIHIDLAGDVDPNVSSYTRSTPDGIPYNYILFTSQAGGMGVNIWRGEYVQTCVPPLAMAVDITPTTINLDNNSSGATPITASLSFPPETQAAGYQCVSFNGPKEGVRMRLSIILSPTMLGLGARLDPTTGIPDFDNHTSPDYYMNVRWNRRTIAARVVALGLVNQQIPAIVEAYSNGIGRGFRGYGILNFSSNSLSGTAIKLQQNYPNPFNPQTKITFAVSKPGNVDVRVFNVRGELVRTITNQNYPQGEHTVSWDGMTDRGNHSPSAVYYIRANTPGATPDVIKAVLAQ